MPENLTAGSLEDVTVLTAFRFHTIVKNYTKPEDHRETRLDLLEIANQFPELNITTYQWCVRPLQKAKRFRHFASFYAFPFRNKCSSTRLSCRFFPYADQYNVIWPTTLRNVLIAMVFMLLVSLVLIANSLSALLIAGSIASISIGRRTTHFMCLFHAFRRYWLHDVVGCEFRRDLHDHYHHVDRLRGRPERAHQLRIRCGARLEVLTSASKFKRL